MALPKLDTPTYRLTLPSTGEEIKYRPFLVKEQKVLMMAEESENEQEITDAVGKMVNSCTFGAVDPINAPMFDVEYIFLQLRAKSVGEKVQLLLTCPDDEETKVPTELNLNDVEVQVTNEHTNEVSLSDTIKIFMKYPVLGDMQEIPTSASAMEQVFHILTKCINEIRFGDEVFNRIDITEKEIDDFVDQMTADQFKMVTDFFDTMPKLRHVVSIKNPKTEVESEVVVEGLSSFLG